MEILPSRSDFRRQVLGDVYFGYVVPTVLCGRSDAFRRDVNDFLLDWLARVLVSDIDSFLQVGEICRLPQLCSFSPYEGLPLPVPLSQSCLKHPDFGLSSLGDFFRVRRFSKILVASPRESVSDVWEVLWGVWADLFKNTSPDGGASAALLYGVASIYLMSYLYHCQVGPETYPIPLSLETVSICLDVCGVVLQRFRVTTVFDVFDSLLRRHCISLCLYDGLQYIPQDRLGRPLGASKRS